MLTAATPERGANSGGAAAPAVYEKELSRAGVKGRFSAARRSLFCSKRNNFRCVKVEVLNKVRNYEPRFAPAGQPQGPWQDGGLNSKARNMPISPLIPGQNYVFQVRAMGGSTRASDWSDPVGHMCM